MTLDDVRDYERNMHEKTNIKVVNYHEQREHSTPKPSPLDDIEIHDKASVCPFSLSLHFNHICLVFVNDVSVCYELCHRAGRGHRALMAVGGL